MWQYVNKVQIDPQTTEAWSIVGEGVCKKITYYREAELLNIATFPPDSINKYG